MKQAASYKIRADFHLFFIAMAAATWIVTESGKVRLQRDFDFL
ncbi:hypothetical protein [Methylocystis sp.]